MKPSILLRAAIQLIFFGAAVGVFSFGPAAHAQFSEAGKLFKETGTKAYGGEPKGLEETVGGVIKVLLTIVGLVFLVLMVYGGYTWMTAQGVEENVQKAKKIITAAVIGLVVVMLAYAITFFITSRLQEAVLTTG